MHICVTVLKPDVDFASLSMLDISAKEALLFSGPKTKTLKRGHQSDPNQTAKK